MEKTLEAFKTKFDKNKLMAEALINEANELANKHEVFSEKYIISGRKALYQLLQEIYIFSEKTRNISDGGLCLNQMKEVLRDKYGIRTQQNSTATSILVRYITKSDRKTSHMYAKAIDLAGKNSIPPEQFAFYLEQQGGIERLNSGQVRLKKDLDYCEPKSDLEEHKKNELINKYLSARSELPIASFRLSRKNSKHKSTTRFKYFICSERNDRVFVLDQIFIRSEKELELIGQLPSLLMYDHERFDKEISLFHKKAMSKRKKRMLKEITLVQPAIASAMSKVKIQKI